MTPHRIDSQVVKASKHASRLIGIAITLMGTLVLFGWFLDIPVLKSVFPGLATMKFNTALLFVLSGISLFTIHTRIRVAQYSAVVVALISLLTIAQYLFSWNLGIDEWLIRDLATAAEDGASPGRMSIMTAVCFALVSGSLLLLLRRALSSQFLALLAFFISLLALAGYLYGVEALYSIIPFSSMALHTALAFFILSIGLLLASADNALMRIVVSDSAGGLLIRRLIPAAVLVPLILGWLRFQGQQLGLYENEFGAALATILNIVVFAAIIRWTASTLHRVDNQRIVAEASLRQSHDELEIRVEERTAELEAVNQELEAFSYSVSHDLRAPLRAVRSFSQILKTDYETSLADKGQHFLERIYANAERMNELIEDLLVFSKYSREPLRKQKVDLGMIAHKVIDELGNEQSERQVEWIIGELPDCQADAALIQQVMVNLLSNALKYSQRCEVARIEVGSYIEKDMPVYFVKDNGAGFDMRYVDKLFTVFQRLHSSDDFEGTGAGLAIVNRIIQRHGGRIWAEAEVDKGASFYFTLADS